MLRMNNDRDRLREALAEHQEQQAQIARERRLLELIEEFQASPSAVQLLIGKDLPMNVSVRRLFFTNKAIIGKDLFGNVIEIEGEFLNGFARSLPFLVVCAWAALMLAAAYLRA